MPKLSHRTPVSTLPSGAIVIEEGADGVYLRFECDCQDALPTCRAACCSLSKIQVAEDEVVKLKQHLGEHAVVKDGDDDWVMARASSGWCAQNDPTTRRCRCYSIRPKTCQDFHCTLHGDNRGWLLHFKRLDT